jgi:ElaB/YqjD/DUF883 family membrane-anchored ribosome-binding protein
MMTQQSSYGQQGSVAREQAANVTDEVKDRAQAAADKAMEIGQEALDKAEEYLKPVGLSIKEKPMTVLAVVGGVAFAAGALWMMRPQRHHSQMSDLAAQLSNYVKRGW